MEPVIHRTSGKEQYARRMTAQMLELYARIKPAAGQKSIEWDESRVKRDNKGEFATQASSKQPEHQMTPGRDVLAANTEAKAIRDAKTREEDESNPTQPGDRRQAKQDNAGMLPSKDQVEATQAEVATEPPKPTLADKLTSQMQAKVSGIPKPVHDFLYSWQWDWPEQDQHPQPPSDDVLKALDKYVPKAPVKLYRAGYGDQERPSDMTAWTRDKGLAEQLVEDMSYDSDGRLVEHPRVLMECTADPTQIVVDYDALPKGYLKKEEVLPSEVVLAGPKLQERMAKARETAKPTETPTEKKVDKNGTTWAKAKAGGETSPVNNQHYKGGQWMPIHGLSVKPEEKPKPSKPQGGDMPKPPTEDGKGQHRQPRGPMSAEEIADEKRRREDRQKWTAMNNGPLGQVTWLGENPNAKALGGWTTLKKWREFTKELGAQKTAALRDSLETLVHAAIKADIEKAANDPIMRANDKAMGHKPFDVDEQFQWDTSEIQRQTRDDINQQGKAIEKATPGTHETRTLFDRAMHYNQSVEGFHKLNQLLQDAKEGKLAARAKEHFSRPSLAEKYAKALYQGIRRRGLAERLSCELYARIKSAAGQKSMFNEDDHPRSEDGEFAPKGEGAEKKEDSGKNSADRPLDAVTKTVTMSEKAEEEPKAEAKEHAMDTTEERETTNARALKTRQGALDAGLAAMTPEKRNEWDKAWKTYVSKVERILELKANGRYGYQLAMPKVAKRQAFEEVQKVGGHDLAFTASLLYNNQHK